MGSFITVGHETWRHLEKEKIYLEMKLINMLIDYSTRWCGGETEAIREIKTQASIRIRPA